MRRFSAFGSAASRSAGPHQNGHPTIRRTRSSHSRYKPVDPVSARVLATARDGAPLITSNAVGAGRVILTTPDYLQTTARDRLLEVGVRLFDYLNSQYAPAFVSGPGAQYMFSTAPGKLITTIINNSGVAWNGAITANIPGAVTAVREYTTETAAGCARGGSIVTVKGSVPAYDLRIFAIEYDAGRARARRGVLSRERDSQGRPIGGKELAARHVLHRHIGGLRTTRRQFSVFPFIGDEPQGREWKP